MSPLKENIETDIQEFIDNNGKKILIQTTDINDYQDSIDMYNNLKEIYPNILDLALGIHPSRIEDGISKNDLEEIDIFKYTKKQIYIYEEIFKKNIDIITAIGECGLDYYTMNEYFQFSDKQKEQ
ncbi:TatD family hydrolase, partial [Candidatus Dojkabacteria bacterium]|nr:TatD family hydrolase [Candidatus Dojkabacteria bacterium]